MEFGKPIQTKRGVLKSTEEALHFIERELPAELSDLSRWTFARDLLIEAERTEKKRDLKCAYRQLRQALSSDLLVETPRAAQPSRDAAKEQAGSDV
jgi:hypothetical protein